MTETNEKSTKINGLVGFSVSNCGGQTFLAGINYGFWAGPGTITSESGQPFLLVPNWSRGRISSPHGLVIAFETHTEDELSEYVLEDIEKWKKTAKKNAPIFLIAITPLLPESKPPCLSDEQVECFMKDHGISAENFHTIIDGPVSKENIPHFETLFRTKILAIVQLLLFPSDEKPPSGETSPPDKPSPSQKIPPSESSFCQIV